MSSCGDLEPGPRSFHTAPGLDGRNGRRRLRPFHTGRLSRENVRRRRLRAPVERRLSCYSVGGWAICKPLPI